MLVSLERVATGFGLGAAAAVSLAILAGLSRLGENAIGPAHADGAHGAALRADPGLHRLVPGSARLPKILLIALAAAFPLYLNTFSGIRNVDAKLAELGQVLHLRRGELVRQIVLPGALPTGARGACGRAWVSPGSPWCRRADQRERRTRFMITQATQFLRNDVIFVSCSSTASSVC